MQTSAKKLAKTSKLVVTFAVVPAAPAAVFCGLFALGIRPSLSSTFQDAISAYSILFVYAYLIAGIHVVLLGIPAFLLGNWLKAIRWWTCMIVSFAIGGLPMATWGKTRLSGLIDWGIFGMIGGFVFSVLWQFWIQVEQPQSNSRVGAYRLTAVSRGKPQEDQKEQ